jgi:hypothetical protein
MKKCRLVSARSILTGPRLSEAELLNAGRLIEAERSPIDRPVEVSKIQGN